MTCRWCQQHICSAPSEGWLPRSCRPALRSRYNPRRVHLGVASTVMPIAMLFPGQGSQAVGMMASLASGYPVVGACFSQASQILGFDLWRLVADGPAEQLNVTEFTQPAMLVAGIATWRAWCERRGA